MYQNLQKLSELRIKYVNITSVDYITDGFYKDTKDLPNFCRVRAEYRPAKGSVVYIEIWLPDSQSWNGIMIGCGNGGMAGSISHHELARYTCRQYAVAHTDMGTSGGRARGFCNREEWKDFGWRATHIMTQLARRVTEAYYGQPPIYSYFVGHSTGGQQAFSQAQRFPLDYDGIIAGVFANNRVALHTYFLWNYRHLRAPNGQFLFDDGQIDRLTELSASYRRLEPSGFTPMGRTDGEYINGFLDFVSENINLTSRQLDALKSVYNGPFNPRTGQRIYCGLPVGCEQGLKIYRSSECHNYYPFVWAFGEGCNPYDFDFDGDYEKLREILSGDLDAVNPDLSEFYINGGKLIAFLGDLDPAVPFPDGVEYYKSAKKLIGEKYISDFFRCFVVPEKEHSTDRSGSVILRGEDNRELLDVLRLWREKGVAPDCLIAENLSEQGSRAVRRVLPYGAK